MSKKLIRELKILVPIAIPASFAQLAQLSMGVADTIMAGHYSIDALAAIAIGTNLLHPVIVFFMGLFIAFNPIVAHFKGSGSSERISEHFRFSLVLAIVITPLAILIVLNAEYLLNHLGIKKTILDLAISYLNATLLGLPGLMLFMGLRFCNEGMFSMPAILFITSISIPINIVLNYWFMYGGLGLDAMGVVGIGYSTALVWTFMFFSLLSYTALVSKYRYLNIFWKFTLPSFIDIKDLIKLGMPIALTLGFEVSMFAVIALLIARYPAEVIGAHQISVSIANICFMIPVGMSQAIAARTGYVYGKDGAEAARITGYAGILGAVACMCITVTILILVPDQLSSVYTQDQQVLDLAVTLLFYAALFQFADGLQVSSAGALRGLKDTKIPMIITSGAYWLVGLPVGYYLAEILNYQIIGYWIGLISGLSCAAILLLGRWNVVSSRVNN